jgi:hypothetical protein
MLHHAEQMQAPLLALRREPNEVRQRGIVRLRGVQAFVRFLQQVAATARDFKMGARPALPGCAAQLLPQALDADFACFVGRELDVMIDEPPAMLRPGMTADVEITTAQKDSVLRVPIQAVVLRTDEELVPAGRRGKKEAKKGEAAAASKEKKPEERKGVFVLGKDDKVSFRAVAPGLASDTDYEVTGDVKPGEKVVIGPFRVLRTLKPDQRVKVEEPKKQGKDSR